ncbi:hypothetical protein OIU34_21575 [Pararhizobium sp. BT-229]|uniref:hypothetical protein n=1 Tax=Pararhizobium sp. BT-229 TaxID=2986923 RepID=UPI0021F6C3D2|nr:hypothetical protein [Pararhizobium sp. BT-229]MCV9964484.1 hypothetical protein [Pararhizobium sp. BT-229]
MTDAILANASSWMDDWFGTLSAERQTELLRDSRMMAEAAFAAGMEVATATGPDWRLPAAELLSKFASQQGKYSLACPVKHGEPGWRAESRKWIRAYWEEVCRLSRLSSIPVLEDGHAWNNSKDEVVKLINEMIDATSIECSEDARAAMERPFRRFSLIAKKAWNAYCDPMAVWATNFTK